mgnify:CR=1 FL=1
MLSGCLSSALAFQYLYIVATLESRWISDALLAHFAFQGVDGLKRHVLHIELEVSKYRLDPGNSVAQKR